MSLAKKVTFDAEGQPKVVIVVEGWSDVIRLNEHLLKGQCEFGSLARRIYASCNRKHGARRVRQLILHCTGMVPWS